MSEDIFLGTSQLCKSANKYGDEGKEAMKGPQNQQRCLIYVREKKYK